MVVAAKRYAKARKIELDRAGATTTPLPQGGSVHKFRKVELSQVEEFYPDGQIKKRTQKANLLEVDVDHGSYSAWQAERQEGRILDFAELGTSSSAVGSTFGMTVTKSQMIVTSGRVGSGSSSASAAESLIRQARRTRTQEILMQVIFSLARSKPWWELAARRGLSRVRSLSGLS